MDTATPRAPLRFHRRVLRDVDCPRGVRVSPEGLVQVLLADGGVASIGFSDLLDPRVPVVAHPDPGGGGNPPGGTEVVGHPQYARVPVAAAQDLLLSWDPGARDAFLSQRYGPSSPDSTFVTVTDWGRIVYPFRLVDVYLNLGSVTDPSVIAFLRDHLVARGTAQVHVAARAEWMMDVLATAMRTARVTLSTCRSIEKDVRESYVRLVETSDGAAAFGEPDAAEPPGTIVAAEACDPSQLMVQVLAFPHLPSVLYHRTVGQVPQDLLRLWSMSSEVGGWTLLTSAP